jgi:hypothetical protein
MTLNFDEISEQFARTLIYVVGSARGGSTFANRVIGCHPDLLYVEWNDKTFSDIWPHIQTLNDEELRDRLFHPSRDSNVAIAMTHIDRDTLRHWNEHVTQACRTRNLRTIFCLRGMFYWLTHVPAQPLDKLKGWCIKANTWEGVDDLKHAIPEARLVFVLRDPRSTALSFAKVYSRRRQESFADHDLLRGAFNWLRNATEFAIRLNRYDDAHAIYFEQLVAEPVTTLNRLYAELGLERLKPAALRNLLDSIEYTNTKTYEEQGKPQRQTLVGVQPLALDRWRQQLSDEQLHWICALTTSGARHYGYELDYRPSLALLMRALGHAKDRSSIRYLALYLYCQARLALLAPLQPPNSYSPAPAADRPN